MRGCGPVCHASHAGKLFDAEAQDIADSYSSKAKVKCAHNGFAPCKRCNKIGNEDCLLVWPTASKGGHSAKERAPSSNQINGPSPANTGPVPEPHPSLPVPETSGRIRSPRCNDDEMFDVDFELQRLPLGAVMSVMDAFGSNFSELRMLHPVLFQKYFAAERSEESKALLAALLSVTWQMSPPARNANTNTTISCGQYAVYASRRLSVHMLQHPDVRTVQALLILTIYEWGTGAFQEAWMHHG